MRKVCVLLLTFFTINLVVAGDDENAGDPKVCSSPGCQGAATDLLDAMDESVDPCDDFYKFACGSFLEKTVIPNNSLFVMKLTTINDRIEEQMKAMLEESSKPDELRPFALAKKLYGLCMDTEAIEKDNLGTIKSILHELGGWPALDKNWNEQDFDWKNLMYKLRKTGIHGDYFVDVQIERDPKNATRHIIGCGEASPTIGRELMLTGFTSQTMQAYYNLLVDIAVIFGADRDTALKELEESTKFQIELAGITTSLENKRNFTATTNFRTVAELQKEYPSIPWTEFLTNIINDPHVKITDSEVVDVGVPTYITNLEALLAKTPKRVLANYVMSSIVISMAPFTTKAVQDRQFLFNKLLMGSQEMKPRWKDCVSTVATRMKPATGAMYVRKYFNEEIKENAQKLVTDLRTIFLDMLKNIDWMDEDTRKRAIEKAEATDYRVAYPEEFLDDKKLEGFYSELKYSENYLQFIMNIFLFQENIDFNKLRKPVDRKEWSQQPSVTEANAAYNLVENSIGLPVAILQQPAFSSDRPAYMNYGGLGFIVGHEITHGFDDGGRQADKDGTLVDWWEEPTSKKFLEKAQCIIDQYSNFKAPEVNLNVNGLITQGENLADNGGIKEAYLAYNAWVERNGEEPLLPGLKYNQKQLFWISTAHLWCSKERNEFRTRMIMSDPHPPPFFRITGTFRNSEHFAKDFNCPVGSKMNPQHKCHVW